MPTVQLQRAKAKKQGTKSQGYKSIGIFRPLNCLFGALGVLASYTLVKPIDATAILGGAAAALVIAGGNAINDVFDVELDTKNKPWRPIPSGAISKRAALALAIIAFGLGITFGAATNVYMLYLTFFASILLIMYSGLLKHIKFIGNIVISSLVGILFVSGLLIAGKIVKIGLTIGFFAFLINWAREIVKDFEEQTTEQWTLRKSVGRTGSKLFSALLILASATGGLYISTKFPLSKQVFFVLSSALWVYALTLINRDPGKSQRILKFGMGPILLGLLIP